MYDFEKEEIRVHGRILTSSERQSFRDADARERDDAALKEVFGSVENAERMTDIIHGIVNRR